MKAQEWFAERTTSLDDWPVEAVVDAKRDATVAVILPARDEAATVGDIVAAIRSDLGNRLVDDVIVVDSGSRDATRAVATASGARVVESTVPGKGAAMQRGVAASTADVIVFVDADLQSFDSRFVAGLLGPLLSSDGVCFVKAGYDRPAADPRVPSSGGGRVTELMARPLISAFWPELDGVLQPLAGEYAARRRLLESLAFRAGYGVDLGLLIDAYRAAGLTALAQVDLRRRWHRNGELAQLGRMAAEVLHTALDRLVADGRLPADLDRGTRLWQPARLEGGVDVTAYDIDTTELPPLRDHPDQPSDHRATK